MQEYLLMKNFRLSHLRLVTESIRIKFSFASDCATLFFLKKNFYRESNHNVFQI